VSKANLSFAIFLAVFFVLIGGAVWWNVHRIAENNRLAAEAAPRMSCHFAQWCIEGDCVSEVPADFTLITSGKFGRAYLRMEQRSGDLSAFFGASARFARGGDPIVTSDRWPRRYMHTQSERAQVDLFLDQTLDFIMTYDLDETDRPDLAPADAEGSGTCTWIVEEAV